MIGNHNLAKNWVKKAHNLVKILPMTSTFELGLYLMIFYPSVKFEWN